MDTVTTGMQTHETAEDRGMNTVYVDMQPKKKCFRSVDQSEKLFPRLPNEITVCRIVPKLPWRAFHILAAVSRAWRQAIQTHRVHDARIHSCSTDTLIVHCHNYRKNYVLESAAVRIAVYSVKEKLCYDLPPIPGHYRGVPSSCQCISLDGKIYVIGGALEANTIGGWSDICSGWSETCTSNSSSKVYVMDLAGASQWKECASMDRGRQDFGCGLIDGKIYALGGTHKDEPVRGAEVYNPKVNAWSPIRPMESLRFGHKVFTLAGKIFVLGGDCYEADFTGWKAAMVRQNFSENRFDASFFEVGASFTEVYHPVVDEWTVEKPPCNPADVRFRKDSSVFMAHGKFYLITEGRIYVQEYDADTDIRSWKYIRESSLPRSMMGPDGEYMEVSTSTVVLNDELLVGVEWQEWNSPSIYKSALLQSNGFGTENDVLSWKAWMNAFKGVSTRSLRCTQTVSNARMNADRHQECKSAFWYLREPFTSWQQHGTVARIAVFTRDKLCYDLLSIPGHYRGLTSCVNVSHLLVKYVVGGAVEELNGSRSRWGSDSSTKVYVLDLAGASHCKECAGVERGRHSFGCGVVDGNIYVFGGTLEFGPVRGAEVYKPKFNAWSPIMHMPSLRFGHKVLTLAD